MTNDQTPINDPDTFYPNIEAVRLQLLSQKLARLSAELKANAGLFTDKVRPIAEARSSIASATHGLDTFIEEVRRADMIRQGYDV